MYALIGEGLSAVRWADARAAEIVAAIRTPFLTEMMTSMTGLGSVTAGVVIVGLFYLAGWREEFLKSVVALSVLGVVVWALMSLVERPFPPNPVCVTEGDGGTTSSFPSGHSAAVTAYAGIAWRSEELPFAVAAGFAGLISFSRVYLGTHYLSDTLFGVGLGIAAVVFAEWFLGRVGEEAVLDRLPLEMED
ncbi:phosphatase PAP2 family protein [Halorubrum sp. AD140]|uniref:phosphatase PAP2 family protein n=1 Tax=Halorubrum sp. AD140 TaxID=3050073 RepID=UPI002ACC563F|nr:phosphatase PAP2 family protein [Halorubrum sp. AD140]MDZ5811768.1 phosphatase PAP2 family protein [Halorubrum sp. AD140]